MNVQGSIDITEHIRQSSIADRIVDHLVQHNNETRDADTLVFELAVETRDKALMLHISFADTGKHDRCMIINTEQNRLGLLIQLTSEEIAELVAKAEPLLAGISYNPKNPVAV